MTGQTVLFIFPLYLSFKYPLFLLPLSPLPSLLPSLLSLSPFPLSFPSLLSLSPPPPFTHLLPFLLSLAPYQPGNIQLPPPALTWSHATGMLTPLLHCLSRWMEESAITQQVRSPSGFFPSLVLTRRSMDKWSEAEFCQSHTTVRLAFMLSSFFLLLSSSLNCLSHFPSFSSSFHPLLSSSSSPLLPSSFPSSSPLLLPP